jgi:hypothetical protein
MCIKREPHEILQPISELVTEVPRMMRDLVFAPRYVRRNTPLTPHRATEGSFAALSAYYGTMENV